MHIVLIILHIVAMITSLALMSTAVVVALLGKSAAARIARYGMALTIVGGATGTVLLIDSPLNIQCAMLTAYLVLTSALYVYGFAAGSAVDARLIRRSAVVQKR